jgi:small conductance mechanosensitive channel
MISVRSRVGRRLLLSAAFLLVPVGAWAQPEADAGPAETESSAVAADTGEALVEQIRQVDDELIELIGKASVAEGEELELLRSRIGELVRGQQENLAELVDLVSLRRDDGADVALFERQGEQLLRRSSRRLRNYILSYQQALESEAERRSELAPGEIQVFEHRMAEEQARLDRYYAGLLQLTEQLANLGFGVEDEAAFLERELGERGRDLLELLQLTKTRLEESRDLLAKSPADADLQAGVYAAEERYEATKTSLMATVHMLKKRGLDHVDLEVRAVEITGEITPDALEVEVAVGLLERVFGRLRSTLVERGPALLVRLGVIAAILAGFWMLGRFTRRLIGRVLARTDLSASQLLKEMIVSLAGRLVLLIGVIIALSQLGINLGPILAGLGIAGFVIGFALQETLANFAAGAMILAYRPFDVGDVVEAAGVTGKVKDMNLVSTRILTPDFQTLVVPNGKIWGDVIRNVTAQPIRRVDMVFGISYEDEIPKAERILAEILAAHDKVLDDPEPVVKVHALNDSSVDFVVRPWAKTDDYWDVYWDITREVKLRFDREGISIPYPQRDVHLVTQSEAPPADGGTPPD